jgi:hypothetical protein
MTENSVRRRIRSGVVGGEVTKSYNCAHSDEKNDYLGFGSSVLAIGGVAHSFGIRFRVQRLVGYQMYSK